MTDIQIMMTDVKTMSTDGNLSLVTDHQDAGPSTESHETTSTTHIATEVTDIEMASNLLGLAQGDFIVLEIPPDEKDEDQSMGPVITNVIGNVDDSDFVPEKPVLRTDTTGGNIKFLGIKQPGQDVPCIIEVRLMEMPEDEAETAAFQEIEEAARDFEEARQPPSVAMRPLDASTLAKNEKTGGYSCNTCNKVFGVRSALASHMLVHTEIRPYLCPQPECKKRFRTKENCKRHHASHTGDKPFECEYCKKRYSSNQGLKEHVSIHTNTKLYKCAECNKEFRQISSLSRHQSVHSGTKRFNCEICSKGFTQATYLRSHMKSHTGERPYRCDICNKLYAHRSDLNRHKILHTGERPYHCDWCGHTFADASSRRRHMRDHSEISGTYTCHLCNQYFRRFGLLKTHLGRRHNIVEVSQGDSSTLKIVGSDSMDLHEADDATPRAKFIQAQLLRVLCQLRKAKPNTQYQFVQPPRATVSELLNATRQFRDSASGVTVEEQDLAVQLAMNAMQAEQNESVLVCEQELPLNQDGSISEHVYLSELPDGMPTNNRLEIVNDKGDVEYIEIGTEVEEESGDDTVKMSEPQTTQDDVVTTLETDAETMETSDNPDESDESQDVNVVEIDENIFQMHYDQQPELDSDDYYRWLETFVELCKCWSMPLEIELYEKITHVHKTLLDVLASPKGKFAEKDHFEFMSNQCHVLGGLVTQHLAAVLTNLK